jgi:hypothetical protein
MTTYEPIDSDVEVNGQTVLSVVHAFPEALEEQGERILRITESKTRLKTNGSHRKHGWVVF